VLPAMMANSVSSRVITHKSRHINSEFPAPPALHRKTIMAHPVVTFPQPPPTSNTLTSHQRQQLLRSTRKLTKLLGSAPHLIDHDSPVPGVYSVILCAMIPTEPTFGSGLPRPLERAAIHLELPIHLPSFLRHSPPSLSSLIRLFCIHHRF